MSRMAKNPRDPHVVSGPRDTERVFETDAEFKQHHDSPLAEFLKEHRELT